MPVRSRKLRDSVKSLTERRQNLIQEHQRAIAELENVQKSVIYGDSKSDLLINHQTRANSLENALKAIDLEINRLESEAETESESEKRRAIARQIKEIDEKAEGAGNRYRDLYSNPEKLSYSGFVEMLKLKSEIRELRRQFHLLIFQLFPAVQTLLRKENPALQDAVNHFIQTELLETGCRLSVLRTDYFDGFSYATDLHNAFDLRPHELSGWIRVSMQIVEGNEQGKARKKMPFSPVHRDKPAEIPKKNFTEIITRIIPIGKWGKG